MADDVCCEALVKQTAHLARVEGRTDMHKWIMGGVGGVLLVCLTIFVTSIGGVRSELTGLAVKVQEVHSATKAVKDRLDDHIRATQKGMIREIDRE